MSHSSVGSIVRLDRALDALVPPDASIEKIAGGFAFTEGPLWRPNGTLWFSDVIGNVVRQVSSTGLVTELFRPGGYDGHSLPAGGFIGPNGMTADRNGGVVLCQHGNRRVVHIDAHHVMTPLVDRFEGRRLNSPNDIVFRSDGSLYFTDPPYGLPGQDADPTKELEFNGVYRFYQGRLQLLTDELTRPNGLAFSPDEKILYVANSDANDRFWMRYDVAADGTLKHGRQFINLSDHPDSGLPDGFKMDVHGNMFTTGPGGVWILTPDAEPLGVITLPEQPANVGWGDDWHSLYICAETSVYRLRATVAGQRLVYDW